MPPAGLVLMGGKASRMGGGDKALIAIAGRPILAHALERFRPQVGPLALSANGDPSRFSGFGLPVLPDPKGGPEGPLGGVVAGLEWARSLAGVTHLATIPGDAPLPSPELVARLAAASIGEAPAAAAGARGIEPLHALWPLAARDALSALIAEGVRSPKRALERLGARLVVLDGPHDFLDLDEPADLAAVERALLGA